jgi:Tol biopolymer transport system component
VPLTSGPLDWGTPIPSKDGQRIFAKGTRHRGELVRYDARSNQLQSFLGGISAEFLSFSRDRSQIAYVTYPDGVLWRAKADGSERVQLTSPPVFPLVCRWSPDGRQILFSARRDSSHYGLYTISTQGGSPVPIVPAETDGEGVDGNWSPDGHRLVYAQSSHRSLWIFDLESRKASKVPGSDGLFSPRWSADGRYIAAMTVPATAVKLFDFQTQQWSILVEHMGMWGFPTWSHDSKFLYALHQSGPWSVDRLPVSGGPPVRIIDLAGVPFTGAVDFWMGLDPHDTPLLLRDNGTSDIYALTLERK